MRIRVLGSMEVRDPGPVPLGGPTQRRTLGMLLVNAGRTVSIDQLVDGIWVNGDAPDRAEQNVPKYVHRLRTVFGDHADRIQTVGAGYRLDLEPDELDAARFEGLIDEARTATTDGESKRALQLFDEALALWNGPPYDDVADLDWARAEVARLSELHASAIERRFELLLGEGRHTELVGPLQEAIGDEPWREHRRAQLALALYRAGRQAEALRVLRDFRAELVDELGLDPSAELDELEHRILDHDPTLLPGSQRRHAVRGYELGEVIGEGAFSLVWRGTQPTLGRTVAVKQIRAELANQAAFIRGFETEAQTIASLEHPHIVPLYDYWREPDSAFLVMRYIAGGSLESAVLSGPLDHERLRRLIEQIGSALHTAHRSGVLHRDVKAANVLLDDDGNFYLSDFGIAFTGVDDELAASLSTGSPAYAAPEQLRRQDLDARSDVYSFGVTVFEAATGRLPFVDAPTQAAMVGHQLNDPVPTPSSIDPSVPSWVDDIVARATAKNPGDRSATVDELLATLPQPTTGQPGRRRLGVADARRRCRQPLQGAAPVPGVRCCRLPWTRPPDHTLRTGARTPWCGGADARRGWPIRIGQVERRPFRPRTGVASGRCTGFGALVRRHDDSGQPPVRGARSRADASRQPADRPARGDDANRTREGSREPSAKCCPTRSQNSYW